MLNKCRENLVEMEEPSIISNKFYVIIDGSFISYLSHVEQLCLWVCVFNWYSIFFCLQPFDFLSKKKNSSISRIWDM